MVRNYILTACLWLYMVCCGYSNPATTIKPILRTECESNLQACINSTTTLGDCRTHFISCIENDPLAPETGVFGVAKEDFVLNFKCCFKDLTRCLVQSKGNPVIIQYCKDGMINCTVYKNSKYSSSPSPKYAWVNDAPKVLGAAVIKHLQCRTSPSMNRFCCSVKYHEQVEVMMVQECFHQLLHCYHDDKFQASYCRTIWDKCFTPDCSQCTECNPVQYSNIPMLHKTTEAYNVSICQQKTNVDNFIDCVINLQLPNLPSENLRRHHCFQKLKLTGLVNEYFTCMEVVGDDTSSGMEACKSKSTLSSV